MSVLPNYRTGIHTHMGWPEDIRQAFDNITMTAGINPPTNWAHMNMQALITDMNTRQPRLVSHGGIDWRIERMGGSWVSMLTEDATQSAVGINAPLIIQLKFNPKALDPNGPLFPGMRRTTSLLLNSSATQAEDEDGLIATSPYSPILNHYRIRPHNLWKPVGPTLASDVYDGTQGNFSIPAPFLVPTFGENPDVDFARAQFLEFVLHVDMMIGDKSAYYLLGNEPTDKVHPDIYAWWVHDLAALLDLSKRKIILANTIARIDEMNIWFTRLLGSFQDIYGNLSQVTPPFAAAAIDLYPHPASVHPNYHFGGTSLTTIINNWQSKVMDIWNNFNSTGMPEWVGKEIGFDVAWSTTDLAELNADAGPLLRRDLRSKVRLFLHFMNHTSFQHGAFKEIVWFNQFQTDAPHGTLSKIQTNGTMVETRLGAFIRHLNTTEQLPVSLEITSSGPYEVDDVITYRVRLQDAGFGIPQGVFKVELEYPTLGTSVVLVPPTTASIPQTGTIDYNYEYAATAGVSPRILRVSLDPDGTNFATCYERTQSFAVVDLSGPTDFAVNDIAWQPSAPVDGDSVQIQAKVSLSNASGDGMVPIINLKIDGVLHDSLFNVFVPNNSFVWVQFENWSALEGSHQIRVDLVSPSPDENDTRIETMAVASPPKPDLAIQSISFSGSVTAGQPFTLNVTVKNLGAVSAPACQLLLTFEPKTGGSVMYYPAVCPALGAAATTVIGVQGTAPNSGIYLAVANVDALNFIDESNESNNTMQQLVTVQP